MTKIFSFLSLIVSIAACALSGAYFVHRLNTNSTLFPAVLLIITTFVMFLICTFNHYNTIMQGEEDTEAENDENKSE